MQTQTPSTPQPVRDTSLSSPQPATPKFDRRIPELDGIRGTAILMVLASHYVWDHWHPEPATLAYYLHRSLFLGWSGVDQFFVLSGFLIGGILLDVKSSANYFRTFYLRRIHRIFPIYYLALAIYFAALAVNAASWGPAFARLFGDPLTSWTYPLFLQNFASAIAQQWGPYWVNITWSLAIEEQFYLVLPLAVRYLTLRRLTQLAVLCILIAPVLRVLFWMSGPEGFKAAYVLTPCRADALAYGVLAAIAIRQPDIWTWLRKHTRLLYISLSILLFGLTVMTVKEWSIASLLMALVGFSWLSLTYVTVLLVAVVHPTGPLGWVFRNPALRQAGLYSYFVYIFHQGVNGLVHGVLFNAVPDLTALPTTGATLLSTVLVFSLAALSWKYIEQPLINRGHTFKYQKLSAMSNAA